VSIAKRIRKQLLEVKPPGYECQADNGCWMLAFDRMANAEFFLLQLVSDMEDKYYLGDIFKIGIMTGAFTSMGPHKTTGMADYFYRKHSCKSSIDLPTQRSFCGHSIGRWSRSRSS
jgi:hypothetical protein